MNPGRHLVCKGLGRRNWFAGAGGQFELNLFFERTAYEQGRIVGGEPLFGPGRDSITIRRNQCVLFGRCQAPALESKTIDMGETPRILGPLGSFGPQDASLFLEEIEGKLLKSCGDMLKEGMDFVRVTFGHENRPQPFYPSAEAIALLPEPDQGEVLDQVRDAVVGQAFIDKADPKDKAGANDAGD